MLSPTSSRKRIDPENKGRSVPAELALRYFADCLALRANLPITKDRGTSADLERKFARSLMQAKRVDAVDERIKTKQPGTWTQSRRQSNRGQRREAT